MAKSLSQTMRSRFHTGGEGVGKIQLSVKVISRVKHRTSLMPVSESLPGSRWKAAILAVVLSTKVSVATTRFVEEY